MSKKILIIDDDPESLTLLRTIFEKEGYLVSTANSSEKGFRRLEADKPDMILLDVILGDDLGTDLCMKIKKHQDYKDIIIILLSGVKISNEDRLFGLEIGATDYINRPFDKKELVVKVNAYFKLKNLFVSPRQNEPFNSINKNDTPVTSEVFNGPDIWETYPNEFDRFVEAYALILNEQIESRIFKTNVKVPNQTRDLAMQFSFLKAGPRDVINVHKVALKKIVSDSSALKAYYIKEESRILLLEMFGYLIMFYRNKSN